MKALLQEGGSIDERNIHVKFGWTPLIAAIYQNNTNVAHYLIVAGANVNLADNRGETALMWATARGDGGIDVVQDLIAHGANVNATNSMGASVLSYAQSDPPKPQILKAIETAIANQQR